MVWLVYSQKLVSVYSAYLGDNYENRKADDKKKSFRGRTILICWVSLVAIRTEQKLQNSSSVFL